MKRLDWAKLIVLSFQRFSLSKWRNQAFTSSNTKTWRQLRIITAKVNLKTLSKNTVQGILAKYIDTVTLVVGLLSKQCEWFTETSSPWIRRPFLEGTSYLKRDKSSLTLRKPATRLLTLKNLIPFSTSIFCQLIPSQGTTDHVKLSNSFRLSFEPIWNLHNKLELHVTMSSVKSRVT